ncbi:MAG: hypothetical protein KA968_14710 [Chitinophagaceae bacterium]|nr:hypothetical protein [Chitinophagaceae bacterium]
MVIVHELNETWEKSRRSSNTNNTEFDTRLLVLENAGQIKDMVKVATTANITLSGTQTIDGIAVVAGNRVLVKDQTDAEDNGIYVVAASAWSRSTDADAATDFSKGCTVKVEKGTANGDKYYTLTTDAPITLGTTKLTFAEFDAYGATNLNTAGKVVKRDASGDFAAGIITASLVGNVTGDCSGNSATSTTAAAISAAGGYEAPLKVGSGATTKWIWTHATSGVIYVKISETAPTSDTDGSPYMKQPVTGGYADSINIGNGFLWIATDGKVYVKTGATAPTGDTDGTIVGTQTA